MIVSSLIAIKDYSNITSLYGGAALTLLIKWAIPVLIMKIHGDPHGRASWHFPSRQPVIALGSDY
jgi:hypothetical protein